MSIKAPFGGMFTIGRARTAALAVSLMAFMVTIAAGTSAISNTTVEAAGNIGSSGYGSGYSDAMKAAARFQRQVAASQKVQTVPGQTTAVRKAAASR